MKARANVLLAAVLLSLFTIVFLSGYFTFPTFATINSTSTSIFNMTPETLRLNWTNNYRGNVTIGSNVDYNFIVVMTDNTSAITANYSQQSSQIFFNVTNNTEAASTTNNITSTSTTRYSIVAYCSPGPCSAGRYSSTVSIANQTNTTEKANATLIVDWPISISASTGVGSFGGTLVGNSTEYQSFYFAKGNFPNATSMFVNTTFTGGDGDVFLLTNDSTPILLAKAINKTGSNERIFYTNASLYDYTMFEIRVYGNSTSSSGIVYAGSVILSALNVSTQNSRIDFNLGPQNITLGTPVSRNYTLSNAGNISVPSVTEEKELFYVKRFAGSGTSNISLILPDSSIISRIDVALNWSSTTGGNYTLRLFNISGQLDSQSVNDWMFANFSGVEREEDLSTTNIGSTGIWTIEVKNASENAPTYTLVVRAKVDDTTWIATNFSSANSTFDLVGTANATDTLQLNVTILNSTLDGTYEGKLFYKIGNNNDAKITIPVSINVTTPVLIGNDTFSSKLFQVDENWGADIVKTVYVNITNPGIYDASITVSNSSQLVCTSLGTGSCTSGFYVNISSNASSYSTLPANSWRAINVTIFNITNNTSTRNSIFDGWILINTTNSVANLTAHPNATFRINLKLNLTDKLNAIVVRIVNNDFGNNTLNSTTNGTDVINVTFNINYVNLTYFQPSQPNFQFKDITNIWLYEANASTYIPASGGFSSQNLTYNNLTFSSGNPDGASNINWTVNVTVPQNTPGGRWQVHVNLTSSDGKYAGESSGYGLNTPLFIQDTGMYLESVTLPTSATVGESKTFTVRVKNFGPLATSTAKVNFSETCTQIAVSSTNPVTVDINAFNNSGIEKSWTVTADNSGSCAYTIRVTTGTWYNATLISGTISVANATSTPSTTDSTVPGGGVGTSTTAAKYLEITSYPSLILVEQKKSNSTTIVVKNINTTKMQDIALKVLTTNNSWATISPTIQTFIGALKSTNFTVTFNIPANAEVKDHDSKFVAVGNYANVSVDFKLRVLPSPETKVEINQTFASVSANYTRLTEEINKSKAAGLNTTEADSKLAELSLKVKQAQDALAAGDYFTANVLITEIKSLIDETYAALSSAQKITGGGQNIFDLLKSLNIGGNTTYIFIAAGVAGALILTYLFWPTKIRPALQKLPSPTPAPRPQVKRETYSDVDRIKGIETSEGDNVWDRLKQKWSDYSKKRYRS